MNVAFFILLWVATPSGGHSDMFGSLNDCEARHKEVVAASDTLYASACIPAELVFVKSVRQEYQRPSEVFDADR